MVSEGLVEVSRVVDEDIHRLGDTLAILATEEVSVTSQSVMT